MQQSLEDFVNLSFFFRLLHFWSFFVEKILKRSLEGQSKQEGAKWQQKENKYRTHITELNGEIQAKVIFDFLFFLKLICF